MIVMKFGGTSVGTGERIADVGHAWRRKTAHRTGTPPVVVVSAMSGVTDSLVRAAATARPSGDGRTFRLIRDELQQRHEQAIADCVTDLELARGLRAEIDDAAQLASRRSARASTPWAN